MFLYQLVVSVFMVCCSWYVIRQKLIVSEFVSKLTLSVILKEILTLKNCRIAHARGKNDVILHSL